MDQHVNNVWQVLYVEDDEEDFFLVGQMLAQSRGHKIELVWAETFDAGLAQLGSGSFDAVLVDYDLGTKTGIELIREFSQIVPVPLILFTGRGSHEIDLEAMSAGATMYLTKSEANPLLLERVLRYAIERKQAEQALRKSEEKFSRAFQFNPAAMVLTRMRDAILIDANETFCRMVGFDREEVVGYTAVQLGFLPRHAYRDLYAPLNRKGYVNNKEFTIKARDGSSRDILYSLDPVEVDGEACLLATLLDITSFKNAEQARQKSEEMFSKAFRSSPVAMAILRSHDQVFLDVNDGHQEVSGYTRDEVIGRRLEDLWLLVDTAENSSFQDRLRQGPVRNFEVMVRQKSGALRQQLVSVENVELNGEACLLLTISDITEQKQARDAIASSRQRVKEILESITDGFFELDRSWRFTYINHRAARNLEAEPGELTGKNVYEQFSLHAGSPQDHAFRTVMEHRQPLHFESRGNSSGNWYEYHIYPSAAGITVFWSDISLRKQVEKDLQHYASELERSNRALRDFTFFASHDLQEPLRKIITFSNLLKTRYSEPLGEEAVDYLERMHSAADRMKIMLQALLSYSRVSSHGEPFAAVDLNEIAAGVLTDLEVRIEETGGHVEVDPLPCLQADKVQMQLLFQNLISNALKYSRPGVQPLVKVGCRPLGDRRVEIWVQDNGIGFDMEESGQIFQPFHRLHSRAQYEGTGMGLAICKKIIERHNGEISVASAPNQGATFTVRLPLSL